jgi:small subunit ribosomal protein S16
MLTIRLTRKGKKNQPFFRVVLVDKRSSSKSGKAIEDLGFVDPLTKRKSFNKERVLYWISKGAKPSASIHNLLVAEKILESKKLHVSRISKKKQAEIKKVKEEATAKTKAEAEKPVEAPAEAPKEEKPEEVKEEPAKEEKKEEAKPEETK